MNYGPNFEHLLTFEDFPCFWNISLSNLIYKDKEESIISIISISIISIKFVRDSIGEWCGDCGYFFLGKYPSTRELPKDSFGGSFPN